MSHLLTLAQDTALRSAVSWSVGFIMGAFVIKGVKALLHKIVDLLDTATPGGLGDVVDELQKARSTPPPRTRR